MTNVRGRWAEDLAAQYLLERGYRVLERNFRSRGGEIDIIAEHQGVTVFVEVRQRQDDRFGSPYETVDWRKRQKLRHTALLYKRDGPMRFDVIAILGPQGRAQIRHIENAFGEDD